MPVPNSINMKFKFPEFSAVDDASIGFAIEEAVVNVGGDSTYWLDDANYTLALMYYAAHLLMMSILVSQQGAGKLIISERTPDLSRTYAVPQLPKPEDPVDLTMTVYGVRYVNLARRNFPGVAVANSAVVPSP